jgi:UrcA family protein
MTFNRKNLLTISASLAIGVGSAPTASASGTGNVQSIPILTSDLNLAQRQDREELDRRIRRAARRLCEQHSHIVALDEQRCLSLLVNTTRPQRDAAIARALRPVVAPEATGEAIAAQNRLFR